MLCQLDDFQFKTHQTDLTQISIDNSYSFKRSQTINHFDVVTPVGKYTRKYSLTGILIRQSVHTLEALERIAQKKQVITLTFDVGKAYQVIITNINEGRTLFLDNGVHLKNDFEIQLELINE